MLTWIVMHLNQSMFSPIEESTKNFLQYLSYTELFIELICLVVLIVLLTALLIDWLMDKKGEE